ncbi:hypothetical protein AAHK20_08465 [Trinickia sp. YCB016]
MVGGARTTGGKLRRGRFGLQFGIHSAFGQAILPKDAKKRKDFLDALNKPASFVKLFRVVRGLVFAPGGFIIAVSENLRAQR